MQDQRRELPIYPVRHMLLDICERSACSRCVCTSPRCGALGSAPSAVICNRERVVVLVGETGSGKTTQLPQYLFASNPHRKGPALSDRE